jgi:hypothetical protein
MHAIVHSADKPQVSSRCPSAGPSNAPSHGSAAAEDWECLNNRTLAFLRLASIRLMLRKLCNRA